MNHNQSPMVASGLVHASTLGLSVYNALADTRSDMEPVGILRFLHQHWEPNMQQSDVDAGIAFLTAHSLATHTDRLVRLANRDANGKPPALRRLGDGTELGF